MKYLEFNEVFGLIYHYMYFRFANISSYFASHPFVWFSY